VTAEFDGTFLPEVVLAGPYKREHVRVHEVPFKSEEAFMKVFSPGFRFFLRRT
jgi:hypothetical protein